MSTDTDLILQALKEHREETRQDLHELRGATVKIADAAADMGKTMARSEERHAQHEDSMKRIGRHLDDHEERLRTMEAERATVDQHQEHAKKLEAHTNELSAIKTQLKTSRGTIDGGWRVITVLGSMILGAAALVGLLIKIKGVA